MMQIHDTDTMSCILRPLCDIWHLCVIFFNGVSLPINHINIMKTTERKVVARSFILMRLGYACR